ncbi:MAG: glutathione S-transferase family protein [Spirochaetaceae bacterium]|nr:glutathione S-transferase family protein [Spirochaetaceae bacterium]HPG26067.1 glutathione S-transferase family protein [Myxococcota bacterium]
MKLFAFPIAPNPTKVRLYLAEKRVGGCAIPLEEIMVDLTKGEQKSPEHLARNPFGLLPSLELDDGRYVWESLAIIEYLEERFPEPSLLGRDPETRALRRQLERIADIGVLISIGRLVHTTDSPLGLPPEPAVADYFRRRLAPNLDYLESVLADGRPLLAGDEVTIGDCTLAAALQFGRFRKLEFLADHPNLRRWDEAYRGREAAQGILVL